MKRLQKSGKLIRVKIKSSSIENLWNRLTDWGTESRLSLSKFFSSVNTIPWKLHRALKAFDFENLDVLFDGREEFKPHISVKEVKLESLIANQAGVRTNKVEIFLFLLPYKKWRPINVIFFEGKNYIVDGHHRALAAKLLGRKSIKANIFTPVLKAESKP